MTLLFRYPHIFKYDAYLGPQIKIEFGRGDQEPSEKAPVTPFVAERFPDMFVDKSAVVIALDSQRTFWEKVTLLHAENHRPDPTKLKPNMARHWSDVAVMSSAERFNDQNLSLKLLNDVIKFKQAHFPSNWAHFETAVAPTLLIVPNETLRGILRKDYQQMEEMFPGKRLSFDEILVVLAGLQARMNALEQK